ncbi:hypothetical protein ACO1O0_006832 [Amphichorda felina]
MAARSVVAIIGTGGMGLTTARRIANGQKLLLADFSSKNLEAAAESLRMGGHNVDTHVVDVSNYDQVTAFAKSVADAGRLEKLVHTAGLSPIMAPKQKVLEVDLLGTANVLDAFYPLASPGLSVVCIASMAGHMGVKLSPELEQHLATAPLDKLLEHPEVQSVSDKMAYGLSKRANMLRVQAACKAWGLKGARINTISPGAIYTPMVHQELESEHAPQIKALVESSAMARFGTADDIANAAAFLLSPDSSFISGADILVDGGTIPGMRWGNIHKQ